MKQIGMQNNIKGLLPSIRLNASSFQKMFCNVFLSIINEKNFIIYLGDMTQPARDVLGTPPEGPLKVLTSGTSMRPSGDSQGTNKKNSDLIKKSVFQMQYFWFGTTITVFYWKNKYSKVVNGDVHGMSTGPSCGTSRGPNDGTFMGRPLDIDHICF